MNISEAKEQVKKTCVAYLTKDTYGDYVMPVQTQRPIFLLGAPGIGKTAIVEQVARELDLGLVDYSMTHHTRQSAMGLPFITSKNYAGQKVDISQYTMSEIIASIYDHMEATGKREGILFLDEVNCVSETLMPMMLRFLQSKMLGNHSVPDGWVVVSAGNPLQYNKSARAFDVVTMDRVKLVEVEPDLGAWLDYSRQSGAHPAVTSFVSMRPDSFYFMQTSGRKREFVTARAWTDLSNMMRLYEQNGIEVDDALVGQYIQAPQIAADFCVYLRLFASYNADYRIGDILNGKAKSHDTVSSLVAKAAKAGFDERAAVSGLLTDALAAHAQNCVEQARTLALLRDDLLAAKAATSAGQGIASALASHEAYLEAHAAELRKDALERGARHAAVEKLRTWASQTNTGDASLKDIAASYNELLKQHDEHCRKIELELEAALDFAQDAWGAGNEMTLMLNEMTMNRVLGAFVAQRGCPAYYDRSETLMIDTRAKRLYERLETLGSDDAAGSDNKGSDATSQSRA